MSRVESLDELADDSARSDALEVIHSGALAFAIAFGAAFVVAAAITLVMIVSPAPLEGSDYEAVLVALLSGWVFASALLAGALGAAIEAQ